MELFETWKNITKESWSNPKALARLFENVSKYLQNNDMSQIEDLHATNILLGERGVLQFLYDLKNSIDQNLANYQNTLMEAFKLLQIIINVLTKHFRQFIQKTENICNYYIQLNVYDIQVMASKTLISLIEQFKQQIKNLPKVLDKFEDSRYTIVIGAIAKYCPNIIEEKSQSNPMFLHSLFEVLLKFLQKEIKNHYIKIRNRNISIILETFLKLRLHFSPPEAELFFENLFLLFCQLCNCEMDVSKEVLHQVFNVFNANINFLSVTLKEYTTWHDIFLKKYADEKDSSWCNMLETFYENIFKNLFKKQDSSVILYFTNYFLRKLESCDLSSKDISTCIYGLAHFFVFFSKNMSSIELMNFQVIVDKIFFLIKFNTMKDCKSILPNFQQALAMVLIHIPVISGNLDHLIQISILIFEHYPNLEKDMQDVIFKSFKNTFTNVLKLEEKWINQYFYSLFEKGISTSCCHTLYFDLQLQKEIQNVQKQQLISYKNYISLWNSMFSGKLDDDLKKVFEKFITALINFLQKLNLFVINHKPVNKSHFRCFLNLVDLLTEVFNQIDVVLLENHTEKLLVNLVKFTHQYPMISGFHKIIKTIFIKLKLTYHYEDNLSKNTIELLNNFLMHILRTIENVSDELQITFITLIINTPIFFAKDFIIDLLPIFSLSFKIGLDNIPLAFETWNILIEWKKYFYNEDLKIFFDNTAYYLEPYLQINADNLFQDDRQCLKALQTKILLHLGSRKFVNVRELVYKKTSDNTKVWEKPLNLTCKLTFSNDSIPLYLDKLLPKTLELTDSKIQRVKFSACELLHTLITIMISKESTANCLDKNLFFKILKLGCDLDDAVRNLFHPFILQLTKLCSTKFVNSNLSQDYFDSLFEGILNKSSSHLYTYCEIRLKEYMLCFSNVEMLENELFLENQINKILNFADYPTNSYRIAAATAFNCLQPHMYSNFWFQFLRAFVKCLEHCYHSQIVIAITNIKNTIKEFIIILNDKSLAKKNIPANFTSDTLEDSIELLLNYCASRNKKCRWRCIELLEYLCVLIPKYKTVQGYFSTISSDMVNNIASKNLFSLSDNSVQSSIQRANEFLKSLDFYIWIFNKNYVLPETVFIKENKETNNNSFLQTYSKFISTIVDQDSFINEENITLMQENELSNCIVLIIKKIFKFVNFILVNKNFTILEIFWTEDFSSFLTFLVFRSFKVKTNLQTLKPEVLENLFKCFNENLPTHYFNRLKEKLSTEGKKYNKYFVEINEITDSNINSEDFNYFVRGATILEKCEVWNFKEMMGISDAVKILQDILDSVKNINETDAFSKVSQGQVRNSVFDVLCLILLKYDHNLATFIINGMTNDSLVFINFENLRVPIFQFLLKNPIDTLEIVERVSQNSLNFFIFIENLLSFAEKNPSKESEIFANFIINNFKKYLKLISNEKNEQLEIRFFNIYRVAVLVKSNDENVNSTADVLLWVTDKLQESTNYETKLEILKSFHGYMIFNGTDKGLSNALTIVFNIDSNWKLQLKNNECLRLRAIKDIQCLTNLLFETKVFEVLQFIIRYIAGVGKFFKQEILTDSLKTFFASMSSQKTQTILQNIFDMLFKDLNNNRCCNEKLDVLNLILLPILKFVEVPVIDTFYKNNFDQIIKAASGQLNSNMEIEKRKIIMVTKIILFKLSEIVLAKNCQVKCIDIDESLQLLSSPVPVEDQELKRQLNCSLLNYLISMVNMKNNERTLIVLQNAFLQENSNFWTQILDLERYYDLQTPSENFSKYIINLKFKVMKDDDQNECILNLLINDYFRSRPVHFDEMLNYKEDRQYLLLENDDLNNHECMPMITSLWIYLFNYYNFTETPVNGNLDGWINCLRLALNFETDNITLFILRLFSNAVEVFRPLLKLLFINLAKALTSYLIKNPINYLIRDVMLMMYESRLELDKNNKKDAQNLVEILIVKASNDDSEFYDYNFILIEQLVEIWSAKMIIFRNLEKIINENDDSALRIILMLFKNDVKSKDLIQVSAMHKFVRDKFFSWRNPALEKAYEIVGLILKNSSKENVDKFVENDLIEILDYMERTSCGPYKSKRDCCVKHLYLIFKNFPQIANYDNLKKFMNPKTVCEDQRIVECLEMLSKSLLNYNQVNDILDILKFMNLLSILNERIFMSLDVVIDIIIAVLHLISIKDLQPYLLALESYINSSDTLIKHKRIIFKIFMDVYDKYEETRSETAEESLKIVQQCTKILVNGISDFNVIIQEDIINFWKKKFSFSTNNLIIILLNLLEMFNLEVASSYSQFFSSILLEFIRESSIDDYLFLSSRKQFPIKQYEIAKSEHRFFSRKKLIPLYAPSIVRILQDQIINEDGNFENFDDYIENLHFEQVLVKVVFEKLYRSNDLKIKSKNTNELSKRSLKKVIDEPSFFDNHVKMVQNEFSEQYHNVKVNRRYEIDYISNFKESDLITTLQDLTLNDSCFAGELTTLLICAMLRYFSNTEMYDHLFASVTKICHKALENSNDFAPTAMQILHRANCENCNAENIVKISKTMNLEISGILLLERDSLGGIQSIYDKIKTSTEPKLKHYEHLMSIYKSIGEKDVVRSILKNWNCSLNSVESYQAFLAEEASDWMKAKSIYKKIMENDPAGDNYLENMYKCLSELSDWNTLDEQITKSLDEHNIWNHPAQDKILPWIFIGQLQEMSENLIKQNDLEKQFFEEANREITNGRKDLLLSYGAELSHFYMFNGYAMINTLLCILKNLDFLHKQWNNSNSFLEEPKLQIIQKLGRISDAFAHYECLSKKNSTVSIKNIIDYWKHSPDSGSDLLNWNLRIGYRLGCLYSLFRSSKYKTADTSIKKDLLTVEIEQRLKISELAIDNGNRIVAKKHTSKIQKIFNDFYEIKDYFFELIDEFEIVTAKYKFLCAEKENNLQKKFKYYIDSWKLADQICDNNNRYDVNLKKKANKHLIQLTKTFYTAVEQNVTLLNLSIKDEFVLNRLEVEDPDIIKDKFSHYFLQLLKTRFEEENPEMVASNLLNLADYYHQFLSKSCNKKLNIEKDYVDAVLTAMSFGSVEASRYFPDLLNYESYENKNEIVEFLNEKCNTIPTKILLKCYKEIFGHLDTSNNDLQKILIIPIVERFVKYFPSAVMYAFREINFTNLILQKKLNDMFNKIFYDQVENFFVACKYLCQPEEFITFNLIKLLQNNQSLSSFNAALKDFITQFQKDIRSRLAGSIYDEIFKKYFKKLEKCLSDHDNFQENIEILCNEMKKNMLSRLKHYQSLKSSKCILLQYYSPFLAEFSFEKVNINVPGQQDVMITKLDSFVDIHSTSKHQSLIIKFIGTDGKFYQYLVKYGSNMRQNEKVQQLLESFNKTLKNDSNCKERRLIAFTYNIVPLDDHLSLVQWVKNSKSLRQLIEISLRNKSVIDKVSKDYQNWIEQADCYNSVKSKNYKQALIKYIPSNVTEQMNKFSENLEWDLLRKTFVKITRSVDCFFKLKKNFIKYYSTICVINWIAGIGDQRLKNILIDVSTGKCFNIDFKAIFGTGIDQPIPELVPFRLTVQILGLLQPFNADDLFAVTMNYVLAAFIKEKNQILIYVDMLLRQNFSWGRYVEEQWIKDCNEFTDKWSSRIKYEMILNKLSGDKPSDIMIRELKIYHNDDQYFSLYKSILNGSYNENNNARSKFSNHNLTNEEQVLCLIDQAKDLNILGRMNAEWCPFV